MPAEPRPPRGQQGYYRFPTVHGGRIVFCADDDLWEVRLRGGVARRLTSGRGLCRYPSLSPDGKQVAFVWSDEGASDVYVMSAQGGEPRRLTWDAHDAIVSGWSADGLRVRYSTNASNPFQKVYGLREVPARGGQPVALDLGPAHFMTEAPAADSAGRRGRVLARHADDTARWKRYRGGRAGVLWIDPAGRGKWRRLKPKLRGQLVRPLWIGDRIYFCSDHDGVGNLYSCTVRGTHLQQHTHHDGFYVRHPATDGKTIVYHCGGDLYALDVMSGGASGESKRVPVKFDAHRSQRSRRFVPAGRYLESADVHPKGHSTLVTARGRMFAAGHWEGAVLQAGEREGVRYRLASWLPDGKRIVAISDAGGEEALEIHTLDGSTPPRRLDALGVELGRAVSLAVAPHGGRVALTNQKLELLVADLDAGVARVVAASAFERITGVAWSPCGRFLAYGMPDGPESVSLHIADVAEGSEPVAVTRTEFMDVVPSFDPDGRYLYFISYRDYSPIFDQHGSDLSFPMNARLCLLTLRDDLTTPFRPVARALDAKNGPRNGPPSNTRNGVPKPDAPKQAQPGSPPPPPPPTRIDFDGIQQRVLAFPLRAGRFGAIRGARDGRVLYTTYPLRGAMARGWADSEAPADGTLRCYDLDKLEDEAVMAGVTSFNVARDGKTLLVRRRRRLRVVGHKFTGPKDKEAKSTKASRQTGWLDLGRLPVEVDPAHEWPQMIREVWRLMRDNYWAADMGGADWAAAWERYSPLVTRVGSRSELSDLIWTMQGELGTSHAYELGGDYRSTPNHRPGFLAADLTADATVKRIVVGDSWHPRWGSPLAEPGVRMRAGDRILAVNGQPVTDTRPVPALLSALSGHEVQLTVARGDEPPRTVTVRTLRSEWAARYRQWVADNRRYVREASGGRLGYIHIPNMGPEGFGEFHRGFLLEYDREGLVVDARFNRGGRVSSLLIEKLTRRRLGYNVPRVGAPIPYPFEAPRGPMVALTNEYCGSDGDIFSHAWRELGLGPLVGMRSWGGVVGIWPRHRLVDGSVTSQPEFAFWFHGPEWSVENHGVDPDMEIDISPGDHVAGRDPQLDAAIAAVMGTIEESPPTTPDFDRSSGRAGSRRRKR